MRPAATVVLSDLALLGVSSALFLHPASVSIAFLFTTLTLLAVTGAYRTRISYRLSSQILGLLALLGVSALMVATWQSAHRSTLLRHLPSVVAVFLFGRLVTFAVLRSARARSSLAANALVVGTGERGQKVAATLLRHRECGIVPVGFVGVSPAATDTVQSAAPATGLAVVADVAHLCQAVHALGVKHLILASGAEPDAVLARSMWQCQAEGVEVWTVPALVGRGADPCRGFGDHIWDLSFERLPRPGQQTAARFVKRGFDAAIALALLVLTAPLLAVLAVAVRLNSPGPVFFRQRRVGQHGRAFELLKFRTMLVNNDSDTRWNVAGDRRVTRVGGILRATSLDELPQILNVLRGDMSLVGPRPERPHFHELFSDSVDRYQDRLRAPVGITGWAQVHGLRGDTSIQERTQFDNFYIEHWSLWLDVVILFRTVGALVTWMLAAGAASAASAAASAAGAASAAASAARAAASAASAAAGSDARSCDLDPADCSPGAVALPANIVSNQP